MLILSINTRPDWSEAAATCPMSLGMNKAVKPAALSLRKSRREI